MITYNEFVAKHKAKFARLSAAERRNRYNQYKSSQQRNGNNKKPNRKRSRGTIVRNPSNGVRLTRQLARLLQLYSNPFDVTPVGLPVFPCPPSAKQTSFLKVGLAVGTAGYGFALAGPCAASDIPTVYYSDATFAGTSATIGATGAQYQGVPNGSQYTAAAFAGAGSSTTASKTLQQRLICAGLRVRYVGNETTRSGTIMAFTHPEHLDANTFSVTQLYAWSGMRSVPNDRSWVGTTWIPIDRDELEYTNGYMVPSAFNAASATVSTPMVILINGNPGDRYELEFIQHHELIGPSLGMKTPNLPDPLTMSALAITCGGACTHGNRSKIITESVQGSSGTSIFSSVVGALGAAERGVNAGINLVRTARRVANLFNGPAPDL